MICNNKIKGWYVAVLAIILLTARLQTVSAQGLAHATLRLGRPKFRISPDFSGLSFEMKTLLPGRNGKHFFRPSNVDLIQLFKTLGIRCLRVGGNTADLASVAIPDDADIDSLFGFAKAAHVKVIYTLRLRGAVHVRRNAQIAGYIMRHYSRQLLCFAIGNEPNLYDRQFGKYRRLWSKYTQAILRVAPEAKFDGPSSTGNGRWAVDFLKAFGHNPHVILLSQHTYVGGSAWKVKSPALGRMELLSTQMEEKYRQFNSEFGLIAEKAHMAFRLEETNSFYNGGAKNVSDTFASALWGLDYMWWWAKVGCNGLNFHTGNWVAAGPRLTRCRYAVFWTVPDGISVHPLGYAMEAFNIAAHGEFVPVHILTRRATDMTAYGAAARDGSMYVTMINKTHGDTARNIQVSLDAAAQYVRAQVMALRVSSGRANAKSGVKLGGGSFNRNGQWKGSWQSLNELKSRGVWHVLLPHTSAMILRLMPTQAARR